MSWLAYGTGVGIELAGESLRVVIARVRPSGVDVLDACTIENYTQRPAAEWGGEYASFLRKNAAGHLAAAVLLPRREMMVRVVVLQGVVQNDMEAALRLQIDALHPYGDGEAAWTWARLGKTQSVLVALTKQAFVDRQAELFMEAGINVSAFTFTAATIYSALRLMGAPDGAGFVAFLQTDAGVETYGESAAKPLYSAIYDQAWERATVMAAAELRLGQDFRPRELAELLPSPRRAPEESGLGRDYMPAYLAAMASACPRLALPVNLLPMAQRTTSSRLIYLPTIILGAFLVLGFASMGIYQRYEDRKYLAVLQAEIHSLEPKAQRLTQLDSLIAATRVRMQQLDAFQERTKTDLDALGEVTRIVAPPAWLNTFEMGRTSLVIAGEADQATGLLKALDTSPQFQNSEFLVPLSRVGTVEIFRIRSAREGVK